MAEVTRTRPEPGEFGIGHQMGEGWFVTRPDGSRDPRRFANRIAATSAKGAAAAKAAKSAKAQLRPCLRCGTDFASLGIHNRLCRPCGTSSTAEGDPAGFSFGAMTGRRK